MRVGFEELGIKTPHQLCFGCVLKLIGPFLQEILAQKKQELTELHPVVRSESPQKTVFKQTVCAERWLSGAPVLNHTPTVVLLC